MRPGGRFPLEEATPAAWQSQIRGVRLGMRRWSGADRVGSVARGLAMIRVILCDDHALIRRGIRDTLSDAADIEVVGEAGDYGELRALMRTLSGGGREAAGAPADVLLLDIHLPGRSGLDVMHALKEE